VSVDGTATGVAPAAARVVATVESAPLTDLLADLLTWSDNTSAELLLKAMGNGTTAGGLAVVRDRLAAWGVSGVALADGSGLARTNVATCAGLVQVLARLGATSPVVQGLAVAGRTGTLAGAPFAGTPAEGVLRAKTGTLTEVKALAGAYLPAGVAPIDVALVVLGPSAATTEAQLWPGLAAALGTYPFRPDLSPFLPLPPA
jgi:D-alanyl-D-alanine carboxypeptidase/D-alanyl-D-alanine-endopeptidase (penicillin-binding protein 4)